MTYMSDAFYFSVDFWCNLVCIRKRRKYIPVQFPISHPVIGYLHHLKRYWSFTITGGMWWVISYIWIQFNVTEGKTLQELRKLTYTSYLESQVRMSVLSFLVQTGCLSCLSCPWPPCKHLSTRWLGVLWTIQSSLIPSPVLSCVTFLDPPLKVSRKLPC